MACSEDAQGICPASRAHRASVPADDSERLAGADAGAGTDDAAEVVTVQEVLVTDDRLHGGGAGKDSVGGVQELADQLVDGDHGGVHGDAPWETGGYV
jgi:hypothetical protein